MTPAEARAEHRSMLSEIGEDVYIRRYYGTGTSRPFFEAKVQARVSAYDATELVGTVVQGDRKIIVLSGDLEEAQFPLPILVSDKCIVEGKELAILSPDRFTRRLAGEVIAIEIQCRG